MAKPIHKVAEPILNEKDMQGQALEKVLRDLTQNADGIQEAIKLLQELHESGILEAVTSLVEAKEKIAKIAVGQMLRPPVTNAINNGMAAAGLLTELNPETTKILMEGLSKGLQKAEEGLQQNQKVGLFDLIKLTKDPDVNRAMGFGINFLKGLGEGMKE
ncbi:DUF1641 domain-containing protein [Cytobacillus oceanisediminis]|uniref:DUF1641 domain-containing protein n=1 Tax=Cytobacillus oceanisediminis TaxID=665099 RepID=UPI0023DCBA2F|nr:DUF1641 domain-containing protein [Cytobacillus oceanisediminis]MDF2038428.1 DUF1641 domain-containing protein [Cytobacillus oceanisediminis]